MTEKLRKRSALDEIKYAFKLFTNNNMNNKITLEDLQRLNKKLDCNLVIEEMELMIKEFDLDHNGSSKQILIIILLIYSCNLSPMLYILV